MARHGKAYGYDQRKAKRFCFTFFVLIIAIGI